jgi:rhodanese-related sulfurtransferase
MALNRTMKISPWMWIPAVIFGLLIALRLGCQSPASLKPAIAARFPHVQWVDSETLSGWVKRVPEKQPMLLDVRTEAEFEVSHIRGAHRVDPDDPKIESLHIAPEATVVVYCSVGYRSAAIVEQIQRAGVRTVYNLEGGIFAWANQGRPVYRENARAELVHPYDELWGRLLRDDLRAPLSREP